MIAAVTVVVPAVTDHVAPVNTDARLALGVRVTALQSVQTVTASEERGMKGKRSMEG